MLKDYKVAVGNKKSSFWWEVIEEATGQVIKTFDFEEDAIAFSLFLMKGGAFDGFTPSFFLREWKVNNV